MQRASVMRFLSLLGLLGLLGFKEPGFGAFGAFGAFATWGSDDKVFRRLSYLGFLGFLGRSQVIISGAGTEGGTIGILPFTELTPTEGGYLLNGHKIFATNSEIADSVTVILKVPDDDGWYRMGTAIVRPRLSTIVE